MVTRDAPPASLDAFTDTALSLLSRVGLAESTRYRLVGVGLSGFRDREDAAAQPELFAPDAGAEPR